MGAVTPPTVTPNVPAGAGRSATGVEAAGVAPVATAGVTGPAPVKYNVMTSPRAAVLKGTGAPLSNVKMAGATADTVRLSNALSPLLLTRTGTDEPAGTSYGICTFNCVGET